jgi:DHA2 family multidrug resistance protein
VTDLLAAPSQRELTPWVPTAIVMAGSVMVVVDTTIVSVALHQIGVALHAGSGIEWITAAYFLAVCAAQPVSGWLADQFGRRRVFLIGLATFTVASGACAASATLVTLVGLRVVQGFSGGVLVPVGMAMVFDLFPRQRHGSAMAVWSMAGMMATAIGPTLGGLLVTVNWHWLFLINVPAGIVTFLMGLRLLPRTGYRSRSRFDVLGLVLGSGGLSLIVLGLLEGNRWGWHSTATLTCLVGGAAALGAFVVHELNTRRPMIQVRMFASPPFRLAVTILLLVTIAQYGRIVFIPLELEGLRGDSALKVGLLLLPPALVSMVCVWIGGRMADHVGPRRPIILGCVIILGALLLFARLTLDAPYIWILMLLTIQSIGMGLVIAPVVVAGLSDLPRDLIAQGTAVRSLAGQVAGAVAVGIFGAVIATRSGVDPSPAHVQAAYNAAFLVASVGVALALLCAVRLPRTSLADRIGGDAALRVVSPSG